MARGIRVGLTGGIGSGKSTVAAFLGKLGAFVIDADAISRSTTATGGAAVASIAEAFGQSVIGRDGALDRARMRDIAFKDPGARKRLEAIIHPLVGDAITEATKRADELSAPCVVYDIPLLIESAHWRQSLETVLVVDCAESTQITRVCARNGLSGEEVRAVIAAQANRIKRLRGADHVICNDGLTLLQLEGLVYQMRGQFGL